MFGHVLVIGGSQGMVGAPLLAARAALRSGAGLVSIASSEYVIDKVAGKQPELMTFCIPGDESRRLDEVVGYIQERKVSIVVIGPGLRTDMADFVRALVNNLQLPMVIDGGALGAFQNKTKLLKRHGHCMLTPHMGEFQRFFSDSLPNEPTALLKIAQRFSVDNNLTLVLKGNPTYVMAPHEKVYTNTTGGPGLATAGSGDVLSGVIGGIVAQHADQQFDAVTTAVYLHGLAGDLVAASKTEPGVIASDVIKAIPTAFAHLSNEE
jgi:hydroxyethylthiazole kinase-like uncharacterized protein yjeF